MKNVIVGLGEALWDCLPDGKKLGGAPANFAYHVGQFGLNTLAVSAIGNDLLGSETLEELKNKGIQYIMPQINYSTGSVVVELDKAGVPTYDIKEGVAWDNIPFTPELEEVAKHCSCVCFGSLAQRNSVSRQTIQKFIEATPESCLKIFDINLRQNFYTKDIICNSLKQANILKINDEELVTIGRLFGYPGLDMENKCWLLLGKYNLDMLVLTCGVNGSYVFAPNLLSFRETPKVEVADTVGAGDSFTGTFAAAILNGIAIPEAHQLAVEASAFVCTQHGAMPQFPKDLIDKIKK